MTITEDKLEQSSTDRTGGLVTNDQSDVKPVRTRRSPAWLIICIALILLGALAAVVLFGMASNSTKVWVAKNPITRGHTITQDDLELLSISNGQDTKAIPEPKVNDIDRKSVV